MVDVGSCDQGQRESCRSLKCKSEPGLARSLAHICARSLDFLLQIVV